MFTCCKDSHNIKNLFFRQLFLITQYQFLNTSTIHIKILSYSFSAIYTLKKRSIF